MHPASAALRKKYPKWAHRHDERRKRKRHSRRRKRVRRTRRARTHRAAAAKPVDVTNLLLMQLLNQIRGGQIVQPSRKHGSNVVSGYAGAVTPDRLAPVRSQDERGRLLQHAAAQQMAAAFQPAVRRPPSPVPRYGGYPQGWRNR